MAPTAGPPDVTAPLKTVRAYPLAATPARERHGESINKQESLPQGAHGPSVCHGLDPLEIGGICVRRVAPAPCTPSHPGVLTPLGRAGLRGFGPIPWLHLPGRTRPTPSD